jgi:hypothetical protein
MSWLSDPTHQTLLWSFLAALTVGILDFVFALNPNAKTNGFLHWIYSIAGGTKGVSQIPPS